MTNKLIIITTTKMPVVKNCRRLKIFQIFSEGLDGLCCDAQDW